MSYDHITKDLCAKAAQDISEAIRLTCELVDAPSERMMIAISATGNGLAWAAAFLTVMMIEDGKTADPEAVVDGLWEMLRPIVLSAAGGTDEPFKALLRRCATAQGEASNG